MNGVYILECYYCGQEHQVTDEQDLIRALRHPKGCKQAHRSPRPRTPVFVITQEENPRWSQDQRNSATT